VMLCTYFEGPDWTNTLLPMVSPLLSRTVYLPVKSAVAFRGKPEVLPRKSALW
jgi:hypothetical protein